tara:strand:+ start:393 stop:1142 length:750 start_codon:yes stop_codon:yes gene_type:complete
MASLKLNINTVSSNAVITSDTVDIVNWKAGQITGTSANVITSTATSESESKLIDNTVNFNSPTTQVLVGDKVINTDASTNATVTAVVNDTTLSLSADIMQSGAAYSIGVPSTSGQVYSATPTDFGVNSYFTPNMAGSIIVNTTDTTKTTILEVINSNRIQTADTTEDYGLAKAFTIHTPSSNYPGYALYVSTSASISTLPATYVSFKVLTVDGDTTTFTNFPIGTVLPVQVKRVFTTGLVGTPVFVAIV